MAQREPDQPAGVTVEYPQGPRGPRHPKTTTTPTGWHKAGATAAGLLIVSVALTAWAFTFVLGGRPVINDLLHRELGGATGVEIALAGLFGFGVAFILGLGWRYGTAYKSR